MEGLSLTEPSTSSFIKCLLFGKNWDLVLVNFKCVYCIVHKLSGQILMLRLYIDFSIQWTHKPITYYRETIIHLQRIYLLLSDIFYLLSAS